jgi:DNA-binding SARP family transcriptional activator
MQLEQVKQKDLDIPASCCLRVFVYGPLEVWEREASGTWKQVNKDAWGKGRPVRSVFKRLLVAPGRRLSRGAIQDDLWPDAENFELADKNVYNAINQIRRVTGKDLVRTFETIYEMANQSVIWVDRDACEALLKEAENWGCTSREALPLLEQALMYLERGELLEGESGSWIYGLRKKSEDMLKQCRLWLAQAYEYQGKLWQAGEQYRAVILTDPSDEYALQRWLEMLVRHGKRQDALKCYQDMKGFMEAQGFPLSNELEQVVASLNQQPSLALISPFQPFAIETKTQEDFMRVLLRRQLLCGFLGIPLLSFPHTSAIPDAGAYLAECQKHIRACWQLLAGKEISVAQFLLCSWLPSLEPLIAKPSQHQRQAAHLAAQGYMLVGLVAILQRRNDAAEWSRRQAVDYAVLSSDISLHVAAIKHLATQYDDLQCWSLQRHTYEQALPLIADATPLLHSRIELGLALAEARLGEQRAALNWWEKAQEDFPTYPEDHDPAYSYADCGSATFNHYGGLMYLELGQAEKALSLLDELQAPVPLRTDNEITLCKVQATLALHDLDRTKAYMETGIQGAVALQSEMRLRDAQTLYQQACALWPNEKALKTLEELFH